MNSRERFLEVMSFNTAVRSLKWEFGFWGENMTRWYAEGLPRKIGTNIPTRLTTINASVYTTAWTHEWRKNRTYLEQYYGEREQEIPLPKGIGVWGGALYWPSQGFPLALDVMDYFGFDKSTALVPVEQVFWPMYEPVVHEDTEEYLIYSDVDGVKRRYQKDEGVIPAALDWPIKDWETWNQVKEERLRLDQVRRRFPANWSEWVQAYKARDYPLAVGGYPCGFFGTLVHLLGYENVFLKYYDAPDLIEDILNHFTTLWIAIWEEIMADVDIDCCHIWEDMSSTKGVMISKRLFYRFMAPCYRRIADFLKGRGVKTILVDTDGNCEALIPWLLDVGVTGLYPMEVSAGMDVVKARKEYPQLQIMGGIPKYDMALGKARIDEFLEPVGWLLEQGGYVPFGDHLIAPGVSWEQFKYYRERLNALIDSRGQR
ncbi:MAG: uroporphyrinogen decarboxylase family protein [Anaerolineae bacterium]